MQNKTTDDRLGSNQSLYVYRRSSSTSVVMVFLAPRTLGLGAWLWLVKWAITKNRTGAIRPSKITVSVHFNIAQKPRFRFLFRLP